LKTIFILAFLLLFSISGCEKNKEPFVDYSTIRLDPFIVNNYTKDAKLLYFNEVYKNPNHFNRENPVLDTSEIAKILKIIQEVYNSNLPEKDIVFNEYKIHARYCYSFNSISLKVKPSLPEIQNMVNRIHPTGNQALDDLLNTFGFDSVKTAYSYPSFPWLTIFTKSELNMIPVVDSFNANSSIILAEMGGGCIGDGNTIFLTRNEHSARIIFTIGTGDCPSGCTYHKYWEFSVIDGESIAVKIY
jgi:hypothetical protein